ncbi:uncharacterized oxidoreductase MexAM1_META1p0182-like [Rhopilema esculentum]|uniref:uncharacterized oxidoreductase MexAM1_META1p0182-like n=1 Tax=Rhopilema esculentum TaxID=499914 RepID=UPI0031DC6751|eukprot:gene17441-9044_t
MSNLINKVAVVTGASSGIGFATSVLFSKLGAKLVLSGRNVGALENTATTCLENSLSDSKPLIVQGDLSETKNAEKLVEETIKTFGQLDILVNNAGIWQKGSIEEEDVQGFEHCFKVNVSSIFYLTKLAVPHLIETKGNIVNVSSVGGPKAFPGLLSYCVSKAALDQFTQCVALELAPKKVRCNAVTPGVIETELHRRGGLDEEAYTKYKEKAYKSHPLGRIGSPEDVAAAIAFLASDQSSFVTGALFPVDGGRHATCLI